MLQAHSEQKTFLEPTHAEVTSNNDGIIDIDSNSDITSVIGSYIGY